MFDPALRERTKLPESSYPVLSPTHFCHSRGGGNPVDTIEAPKPRLLDPRLLGGDITVFLLFTHSFCLFSSESGMPYGLPEVVDRLGEYKPESL